MMEIIILGLLSLFTVSLWCVIDYEMKEKEREEFEWKEYLHELRKID